MKLIKRIFSLIIILIFTFNIGCSKVNGKDTQSIKAPNNENLTIRGMWKIEDINIVDDEIENKDEILSQKDSLISISSSKISIFNKTYQFPTFKLKVVDGSYVLSYELNLTLKDIIAPSNKVDIISLIDSNNLIGEFIVIDNNNGYLFYSGLLLKLVKEDVNPRDIENSTNKIEAEVIDEDYNSNVGVMLALKTSRRESENGIFHDASYRTLWISFKDNKIEPILEKNNIIFPRLNGIWTIEKKEINDEDIHNEYFIAKPIDGREDTKIGNDISVSLYKDINFISNDYISIERFEEDDFNYSAPIYRTIPIDNINSYQGLSINEIYSTEVKEKYERDFNEAFNSLSLEEQNSLINKVDYTNFTIKRIEGKWALVGKIISKNPNEKGVDFKLSINPNKKILNYDTLLIPWKDLKGRFPFIEDAYTSPTGRIAIIIFNNKLFVYEIEEGSIKGNPLISIDLNEGESVIMAEWATGSYVDTWTKAFKDGRAISE
ncbi:hypothetical protein [Clostridium sp.]|uniref:hypothetical protein n=1 Tax=Clostridium sp. TaxID=1506 RepID=UPI002910C942|nr:hypothetical protein [Clostridium sp.]MDU5106558.1 hypothetical protein [Clostridium sp.]